jgi:hypothetical protein
MKDVIDRAGDINKLCDIMLDNPESRIPGKMADIGGSSGDQIVDRQNLPAVIEQGVAQMRPKKSRSACDYRAQWSRLSPRLFCGRLHFFMIRNPSRGRMF